MIVVDELQHYGVIAWLNADEGYGIAVDPESDVGAVEENMHVPLVGAVGLCCDAWLDKFKVGDGERNYEVGVDDRRGIESTCGRKNS